MPRPVSLELADVLRALTFTAQRPAALAENLGVSRATLHRKLAALLKEELVVKTGRGPQAAYRRSTPEEEFAKARRAAGTTPRVRISLSSSAAHAVRDALEGYARIGIGQLEELVSWARFGVLGRRDGQPIALQHIDAVEQGLGELKYKLLGMAPHASFGIFSPHVQPSIRKSWALCAALRHRLAWDNTPEGSIGVWYDEPMHSERIPSLVVVSEGPAGREQAQQRRYHLEMDAETAACLAAALRFRAEVLSGNLTVLLELTGKGLLRNAQGELVSEAARERATPLVTEMQSVLFGTNTRDAKLPDEAQLVGGFAQAIEAVFAPTDACAASRWPGPSSAEACVQSVTDSPFTFSALELPAELMVSFKGGAYRVIGPSQTDGYLVVLAESHSLQTAVMMARNKAKGAPARNTHS